MSWWFLSSTACFSHLLVASVDNDTIISYALLTRILWYSSSHDPITIFADVSHRLRRFIMHETRLYLYGIANWQLQAFSMYNLCKFSLIHIFAMYRDNGFHGVACYSLTEREPTITSSNCKCAICSTVVICQSWRHDLIVCGKPAAVCSL